MKSRGLSPMAALPLLLAGCGGRMPPAAASAAVSPAKPVTVPDAPAWRAVAMPLDVPRIQALPEALARARAAVPKRLATRLSAQGAVVDPGAAQLMPQMPPGSYYCRLVRFGGVGRFRAFPPDFCYVDVSPQGMSFTKQTGTTLPEGYFHPDTDRRLVFLGTSRTIGEKRGRAYGQDPATDQVGIVERVAPFRWRLLLGRPGQGATLDMYELVPVPTRVQGARPAIQPG